MFLRRLPALLVVATLVSASVTAFALLAKPVYRASARILVEAPAIASNEPTTISRVEQLQIIQERVRTRENLLALADDLEIYGTTDLDRAWIAEDMRARTKFELESSSDRRDEGATIFQVSFDADDAQVAARAVNALTRFMLDKNTRSRTGKADDTSQFYAREHARLSVELNQVEAKIVAFKAEHSDTLPEDLAYRRAKQQNFQERLLQLGREASSLRSRRDALRQMREARVDLVNTGPLTAEQQQLQGLRGQLAEQLSIFSEQSPNIGALKSRIGALETIVRAQASNSTSDARATTLATELDLQSFDADGRLKSIDQETDSVKAAVEELTQAIEDTPATESALAALVRNRDAIQSQLKDAEAKLAAASTGQRIELLAKGERFSLVEPAAAPLAPVSPQRRKIVLAGLGGGVGAGLLLFLLLEITNRTVRRPSDIEKLLGARPLAVIPEIRTAGELRMAEFKNVLTRALVAFAVIGSVWAIIVYSVPIEKVYWSIIEFFQHG